MQQTNFGKFDHHLFGIKTKAADLLLVLLVSAPSSSMDTQPPRVVQSPIKEGSLPAASLI